MGLSPQRVRQGAPYGAEGSSIRSIVMGDSKERLRVTPKSVGESRHREGRAAIDAEKILTAPPSHRQREAVTWPPQGTLKEMMSRYRRHWVRQALADAQGNKTQAARQLGISVQHLFRLLKQNDSAASD